MRASHLDGSLTPPGTVVAWQATAASVAAAESAPVDPRPLTADQAAHVASSASAEPGVPELAPWIGFSCLLPADLNLADRLGGLFDRHESLRSVIDRTGLPHVAGRRLVQVGAVSFEPDVLAVTSTSADSYDIVAGHLASQARCAQWPYAGFVTIETDDAVTLFAAFDHVTFDGYSAFITLDELLSSPEAPMPATGSHVEFAESEARVTAQLTLRDEPLLTWSHALTHGSLPAAPHATAVHQEGPRPHRLSTTLITDTDTADAFAQFCRQRRVGAGVGFIGAFAHAALEQQPGENLDMLISTHNRILPHWQQAIGWFAGVAPITVEHAPGATLMDTLVRTSDTVLKAQSAGAIRIPMAAERLGAMIEPGLVLSYLDGRRIRGWERWDEVKSHMLLGHVAPSRQLHLWINLMPTGLYLEARHPDIPATNLWVERVATRMRALLRTTVAAQRTPTASWPQPQ